MKKMRIGAAGKGDAARGRAAAKVDPENPPLTREQLAKLRPVSRVKRLRWKLGLSQEEFATRYGIPLGTLRDWEQGRSQPDAPARALLKIIEAEPKRSATALAVA